MSWKEEAKKRVALEAVKHVEDGFVVGLGSGSTAAYVIQELGRLIQQDGLRVIGVPSSSQAFLLAVRSGVPVTTLDKSVQCNTTSDVRPNLNGHGYF